MSNSSLVSYTKISQHKNSPRNQKIDTITIHCYAGRASVESMGSWFSNPSAQASCNYGIGEDGRIALIVDEKDRSWCTSSPSNDNRAITIECSCSPSYPYEINDKVYKSLINLCADICKRNGIPELRWVNDPGLIGQVSKQNMTVHRWFKNKECPGEYIFSRLGKIAAEVNEKLSGKEEEKTAKPQSTGLQAASFKGLGEKEFVAKIGSLFTDDQKKNGVLASVSLAQCILESGYGQTELAQKANNVFGMKTNLSGNTWSGSSWDGKSKYTKKTQEYSGGKYITVTADFRKYSNIEDSIADHSAYLLGAMNGKNKRYSGLKGCTDHEKAIKIIKDGGYATDPSYIDKILNIIDNLDLKKYDVSGAASTSEAAKDANKNAVKTPSKVKVSIGNLNIRKGPGVNYAKVGKYTGIGIFTIMEVKSGLGSSSGWGKLKSGAGWISLDYAKKV